MNIVHYHIFKNAGTSVDYALQSYFNDRWVEFRGRHAHDVRRSHELQTFMNENSRLIAISTHLGRPPLPEGNVLPLVFLRHPILRFRSVYAFVKADRTQPGSERLPDFSLKDYAHWAFGVGREEGGVVVRNYQTVHLSDASFRTGILHAEANGNDLDAAKQLLDGWPFVGIVEAYGESCRRYESLIQKAHPDFVFVEAWINRSGSEVIDVERHLAEIREELGEDLYRRVEQENLLDFELYAWARQRFDIR